MTTTHCFGCHERETLRRAGPLKYLKQAVGSHDRLCRHTRWRLRRMSCLHWTTNKTMLEATHQLHPCGRDVARPPPSSKVSQSTHHKMSTCLYTQGIQMIRACRQASSVPNEMETQTRPPRRHRTGAQVGRRMKNEPFAKAEIRPPTRALSLTMDSYLRIAPR